MFFPFVKIYFRDVDGNRTRASKEDQCERLATDTNTVTTSFINEWEFITS